MGRLTKFVLGVMVATLAVWSLVSTVNFSGAEPPRPAPSLTPERAEVPQLVGWELGAALRRLEALGLAVTLRPIGSIDLGLYGRVLDQRPLGSTPLSDGEEIEMSFALRSQRFPATTGTLLTRNLEIDGRDDLTAALRGAGLFEAVVLPSGRPVELTVFPVGSVYVRTEYVLPDGGSVIVSQSNGLERAYGSTTSVRGEEGVLQDDKVTWTERGYSLSVTSDEPETAESLVWTEL